MKTYEILFVFLLLFGVVHGQSEQSTLSYSAKDQLVDFAIAQDKYYITMDTEYVQELENNNLFASFQLVLDTSAIVTLHNKTSFDNTIQLLHNSFGNKIKSIDIVLVYEDGTIQLNSNQIIVKAPNTNFLSHIRSTESYELTNYAPIRNVYILTFAGITTFEVFDIVSRLNKSAYIDYAEPNFILLLQSMDAMDPLLLSQWGLQNTGQFGGIAGADIQVTNAWNLSQGAGIKIAVLDEGVKRFHPDLLPNMILAGYDATGQGSFGECANNNYNYHGTLCAGVIAMARSNEIGGVGVAPNAKILPVRIAYKQCNTCGWTTSILWMSTAFIWAKNAGADVISNSWGGGSNGDLINDAITDCVENGRNSKGCVVLFASGNNNGAVSYPASLPQVIAVGASTMCDERKSPTSCDGETTWGSNYGQGLSVVAPGVKIYTTNNDYWGGVGYAPFSGTSLACPHVAGVVALILAVNPNLTQKQVRYILESTTDKIQASSYNYQTNSNYPNGAWCEQAGYGRVNATRTVWTAWKCRANTNPNFDLYIKDACVR